RQFLLLAAGVVRDAGVIDQRRCQRGINLMARSAQLCRWPVRHGRSNGSHETATGVVEGIKAVEEAQTSVDERRTVAADQNEMRRSQRIGVVTERERVERS